MKSNYKQRWFVLFALSFALLAVGLDMTVLNIALPTFATELNASTSELQWIVNAYNLSLAAMLLPAGMLGDRLGRKKILMLGLGIFGFASIGCALSTNAEMLIGMRTVLGLGAAILIPLSMSILPILFKGVERTRAMMIWATANMLGIPLGPIIGGYLLKHFSWEAIFWLNLPFVAIGLLLIFWLMPESRSKQRSRIDYFGIIFSSIGLVSLTYGFIQAGEESWLDVSVMMTILLGMIMLSVFVWWERSTKHPLIELTLFRSVSFTWGAILATLVSFALFGLLFVLPQFFQNIVGVDALGTGLRLLPMVGGLIIGAKTADRLILKIGWKYIAAFGFIFLSLGLFIGVATDVNSSYGFISIWMIIIGIGMGFSLPTTMDAALGELSTEKSGVGSAVVMALRQVGGSIGVAILGSILNATYRSHLDVSLVPEELSHTVEKSVSAGVTVAIKFQSVELLTTVQNSFIHGMGFLLIVCGAIAVIGGIFTVIFLPHKH